LGLFFYSDHIHRQICEHNYRVLKAYARLWALAATRSAGGAELNIIFEEIIEKNDFPMVLTSVEHEPMLWRNVPVDPRDTTEAAREKLRSIIKSMENTHPPVPIFIGQSNKVLGYIYYSESGSVRLLRYVPLVELLLVAALLILVYVSYNRLKYYEEQNIWLGMARETAHQLGTPISSLMGWLELLKEEVCRTGTDATSERNCEKIQNIVEKMGEDVENLNMTVLRFGQVGSTPELEPTDLPTLLTDVVNYYRERTPRLLGQIEIIEQYDHVPNVMANKLLLSWAVENLIKNSMEAAPKKGGLIKVATRMDVEGENVQIIVTDNGRGIPPRRTRRIFSPGYTTKKRGWGLGLSLAKRIVEEYHFGKLYLLESKPFDRTTFVISFPIPRKV